MRIALSPLHTGAKSTSQTRPVEKPPEVPRVMIGVTHIVIAAIAFWIAIAAAVIAFL